MAVIRPHPGPQEQFLSTSADLGIYGSGAGCGKTYALLSEGTRHLDKPNYSGMIFHRVGKQITIPGGLWDTATNIYTGMGGKPNENDHIFKFSPGTRIQMSHMEHEKNRLDHQGGQYAFTGWDELTHFTERQFWYVWSRQRPPDGCTVKPYTRATTNPIDKDDPIGGWVRCLVDWWIDEDGYYIPKRNGVLKYFTRTDDSIIWVPKDYRDKNGNPPKSMTFIGARLHHNPTLVKQDPSYAATLNSLCRVDRLRLSEGNWNVSEKGGMFDSDWFKIVDEAPQGMQLIRYWDRAATDPSPKNPDPDWTAGGLCGIHNGTLYILDMKHFQKSSAGCEEEIKKAADNDGYDIQIGYEQEPGSAGVDVAHHYQTKVLKGYTVLIDKPTGDKIARCKPWNAWAEQGNVCLVRGKWNDAFTKEAFNFPNGKKDQIDSISGAFKYLTQTFNYSTSRGRV